MSYLDVVFTRLPGGPDEPAEFIELEDSEGRSTGAGEWVTRPDGSTALRIQITQDTDLESKLQVAESRVRNWEHVVSKAQTDLSALLIQQTQIRAELDKLAYEVKTGFMGGAAIDAVRRIQPLLDPK